MSERGWFWKEVRLGAGLGGVLSGLMLVIAVAFTQRWWYIPIGIADLLLGVGIIRNETRS